MESETIVVLAVLVPLAGYMAIGLLRGQSIFDFNDDKSRYHYFLFADGEARKADLAQSSVAYAFQIYTTFFFIFWGYRYGLASLLYIISWFIGILLFYLASKKILIVRTSSISILKFLAENNRAVRASLGAVAFLFFISLIYLETYYGTQFLSSLSGGNFGAPGDTQWWIIFALVLVTCALYSCYGGLPKTYLTDKIQLSAAYLGFGMLMFFLLFIYPIESTQSIRTVSVLCSVAYGILMMFAIMNRSPVYLLIAILIPLACLLWLVLFDPRPTIDPMDDLYQVPGFGAQLAEDYGFVTLLAFSLANIVWQFSDASNYQRFASLKLSQLSEEVAVREIKKVLLRILIASPLTWSFGILIGMAAAAAQIDSGVFEEVKTILEVLSEGAAGDFATLVFLILFGIAVTSVMLSTLDTSIIALAEVVFVDLFSVQGLSKLAIFAFMVSMLCVVFLFGHLHVNGSDASIEQLVGFSASLLPLVAPAVISRFVGYAVHPGVAATSVLLGAFAAGWATFQAPEWHINVLIGLPILSGFATATLVVLLGYTLVVLLAYFVPKVDDNRANEQGGEDAR